MKVKNSTMQAFPFIEPEEDDNIKAYHPGMTMRDEFAKAAMQGILSDPSSYDLTKIAALAVVCADNLIDELNKTEK